MEESKLKRILFKGFGSFFLCMIAQLVFLMLADTDPGYNPLTLIKKMLQSPFVSSVEMRSKIVEEGTLNQIGERSGAFIENWPGTQSGCDCRNVTYCKFSDIQVGKLTTSYCYNEYQICGCVPVSLTLKRNFTNLNGSEFDKILDQSVSFASVFEKI